MLTGATVTVIEDVPVFVSLVAVIVVAPAPTAVTRPLPSTVAAAVLLDVHVTTRPVSTLLAASRSVAASCCVGVTPSTKPAVAGATVTVFTGASVTVTEDVPVFVSLVAVIVVTPAATAVTKPFASTVAAAALLEVQVTSRPVSTLPIASFVAAVNCCVGDTPKTKLAEAGLTVTVSTGASVTVIEDVPVFVSLVAVIVVAPAATTVTRPFPSTVAAAGLLEVHVTVRPVSTPPFASSVTEVSCCVGVTPKTKVAEPGLTVTVATGASVTAIDDVPVFVSLVAVIVVTPAPTAVTRPFASTVAAAGLLELHVITRPVRTLLAASRSVAVNCWVGVIPTTRLAEDGVTVTVLTGASVTVIEDVPVFVSLVAVIVVAPAPTAVTRPFPSTVAAAGSLEVQVTVRPVSTFPFASLVTEVSCCVLVSPKTKLAEAGLTVTVATGTGLTVTTGVGLELTDSLVAVIVAVPTPAAVTVVAPFVELAGLTVSTDVLLETHETTRPASTLPFTSLVTAVSTCVPPTTIAVVGVESVTLFTGASVTVIEEVPVFVSLVAVIVVAPAPTAVTRPLPSTVAAAVLLEVHVTTRPLSTLLAASRGRRQLQCQCPPSTKPASRGDRRQGDGRQRHRDRGRASLRLAGRCDRGDARPHSSHETARIYGRCRSVARLPCYNPTGQHVVGYVAQCRRKVAGWVIFPPPDSPTADSP